MADFNYSAFYQRMQDMKQLQVPAQDVSWVERHKTPDRSYEVILYLGCNILRTPHVAQQVIDVFEFAGVDFVPVGGAQYCCGVTWDRAGDIEDGQGVATRTIGRFEDYGARTVVMWCPSCNVHFTDAVFGRDHQHADFETTYAPRFLADLAARGQLRWQREVPLRVALHSHRGKDGHATGQTRAKEDRETVIELLEHVPGVEVVTELRAPAELGFDCGPVTAALGRERFLPIRQPDVDAAHAAGVDAIVTISHACQREWCDAATDSVDVRNYISLVAEALGCPPRTDTLKEYRRGMAPDEVVAASCEAWSSHGLTEEEARRLAERYFGGVMQP